MRTENHGSVRVEEEELIGKVLKTLWKFDIPTFEPAEVVSNVGIEKPNSKRLAYSLRACNKYFHRLHIPRENGQINTGSSSLVTSRFVRGKWSVEDVITYFVKSRQIDRIHRNVMDNRPDITPKESRSALAYSLYIVSKGWIAERQLDDLSEKYVKMGETHDKAGIDFINKESSGEFMGDSGRLQLRSWRHGYDIANGTTHDRNGNKLLFWAWIRGELHTSEDWKALCDQKRISLTREEMAREWEVEFPF